ncbi:MAG: aminotransferase class V-fold PLP-dependent enzyme, partial [Propionibacteriaceae bacterium]|nr:aminotransferase class V-fold PLP-dependent enzyme [Propionibacteriaceae bacterium]
MTFNFSSGPAALPDDVVTRIHDDLPDWNGTGMPVMAVSHRGADFTALMGRVDAKMRAALSIPDSHEVLVMQGGGMGQFAAVPLNLTDPGDEIAVVVTGHWGASAAKEAAQMGLNVVRVADEAASGYT